ncbi:lysine transporter LysE [Patiriisocius marinus]|uniref:Lysine transporter LysE n=1 Tax=Patiriisocius marinus TaxID=1397112 RepID=A0A5J4J0M5_9FLAO|nr:lysine transporter LysE [Patiriisocius marinus]GER60382.1 lysine transporter LysE [Patiriisocius marinus]
MSIFFNFIIGFVAAFIGVIPPGLLNMSAAKISRNEGRKKALLFSIGVCITVIIQTFVALLAARYLDNNPDIIKTLQQVALGIFICLTIYFFFIAKDTRRMPPKELQSSKKRYFFNGMLIAAINLLPLPYWVYISVTFSAFGWFSFETYSLLTAVIASALGTFSMLIIYIQFFKRKDSTKESNVNMNYIIGAITAIISIITAFKIFKDF